MADTEVERILSQIREQVRADFLAKTNQFADRKGPSTRAPSELSVTPLGDLEGDLKRSMRAGNAFPALTTKRTGPLSRVELWIKRRLQHWTHWYTWEQIEFNTAIKATLTDVLAVLSKHERSIIEIKADSTPSSVGRSDTEPFLKSLNSRLSQLEQKFVSLLENAPAQRGEEQTELRGELTAIRGLIDTQVANLREEQLVAFKQLSLVIDESFRVAKTVSRDHQPGDLSTSSEANR